MPSAEVGPQRLLPLAAVKHWSALSLNQGLMLAAPNNVFPIHPRPKVGRAAPPLPSLASAAKIGTSIRAHSASLVGSKVAGWGMRSITPSRIQPIYKLPSGPSVAAD